MATYCTQCEQRVKRHTTVAGVITDVVEVALADAGLSPCCAAATEVRPCMTKQEKRAEMTRATKEAAEDGDDSSRQA